MSFQCDQCLSINKLPRRYSTRTLSQLEQSTMFSLPSSEAHSPTKLKSTQSSTKATAPQFNNHHLDFLPQCRGTSPAEDELMSNLLKAKHLKLSKEVPVRCTVSPSKRFCRRVSALLSRSTSMSTPASTPHPPAKDERTTDPPPAHSPTLKIWPWTEDEGKDERDSASCHGSATSRRKRERESGREGLESYGYGFYWQCCNKVCRKVMVIGDLGPGVTMADKEPVGFDVPFFRAVKWSFWEEEKVLI